VPALVPLPLFSLSAPVIFRISVAMAWPSQHPHETRLAVRRRLNAAAERRGWVLAFLRIEGGGSGVSGAGGRVSQPPDSDRIDRIGRIAHWDAEQSRWRSKPGRWDASREGQHRAAPSLSEKRTLHPATAIAPALVVGARSPAVGAGRANP
jgi:hypothetical protein